MAGMLSTRHDDRPHEFAGLRPISSKLRVRPTRAAALRLTAGRTDGVGEPTIGGPSTAASAVVEPSADALTPDTSPLPTSALVREAIGTALDSINALEHQARDTARRFRRQTLDDAHQGLAHLVESTQTLLKLAVMIADATETDVERVCADHGLTVDADTQTALSALIARQLERDWFGLARALDESFVPVLRGWRALLLALDGSSGPWGHAA